MEKEDERADIGKAQSVSRCMSMSVGVLYLECDCYGVKRERESEKERMCNRECRGVYLWVL